MDEVSVWLEANQQGWPGLKEKQKKPLFDFAMLWPIFEARITKADGRTANARLIDEEVAKLKDYAVGPAVHEAWQYYRKRYFLEEHAEQRRAALQGPNQFPHQITRGLELCDAQASHKLVAVLVVIYRLRNNFFHGQKAQYGYQEQKENFHHANKVLMEVAGLWPSLLE